MVRPLIPAGCWSPDGFCDLICFRGSRNCGRGLSWSLQEPSWATWMAWVGGAHSTCAYRYLGALQLKCGQCGCIVLRVHQCAAVAAAITGYPKQREMQRCNGNEDGMWRMRSGRRWIPTCATGQWPDLEFSLRALMPRLALVIQLAWDGR